MTCSDWKVELSRVKQGRERVLLHAVRHSPVISFFMSDCISFSFPWYMWLDDLHTSNLDHSCLVCELDHHFISIRTEVDGELVREVSSIS